MAFVLSFFLSLVGLPPPDTPGGPIVQTPPVLHIAAAAAERATLS